ncbi:MAG: phosphoribosyl-ATP diphosphatase [Gammaproteobacteria bacterium]|nr:MAG: phosphoribosyl-ATP diphosphatase [Gammaproteobacteria bacterium]
MLIPSIDLLDGKAVQLRQGNPDDKQVEVTDVMGLLDEFSLFGEVAIIDLNAALGRGDNRDLIGKMLKRCPCRVGGGIRDYDSARELLSQGASKIIIGTAIDDDFIDKLPKDRIVAAIDVQGDEILSHGWQQGTQKNVFDELTRLAERCGEFLYTQVHNEGLMQGVDSRRIERVIQNSPVSVTVAGGITTAADVALINALGGNCQIGMAVYTGKLTLAAAFTACVDFTKSALIPTVVQDIHSKQVLMLAYSNAASLADAIKHRKGTYWSRSRNALWEKGLTSGNGQTLKRIDIDCDGDTLLFLVEQQGNACHFERYSCFTSQQKTFSLDTLDNTLSKRLQQAKNAAKAGSFTQQLFNDTSLQTAKLREECEELIEAKTVTESRWEAADVIFFALVMAKAKGVSVNDIVNELSARSK